MKKEVYSITPKGTLYLVLENELLVDKVIDALELYMRRSGLNAIVLHQNNLIFTQVEESK